MGSVAESVAAKIQSIFGLCKLLTRVRDKDCVMNILAAMGAYCFFSTKPHVNFDYEIPPSDGQLVIWQ